LRASANEEPCYEARDVFMENVADKNNCLGCLVRGTISISALLSQMTWESLLPSGFCAVNLLLTSKQIILTLNMGFAVITVQMSEI